MGLRVPEVRKEPGDKTWARSTNQRRASGVSGLLRLPTGSGEDGEAREGVIVEKKKGKKEEEEEEEEEAKRGE